jgi:hypothetical protein
MPSGSIEAIRSMANKRTTSTVTRLDSAGNEATRQ